ncbi:RNA-binding S4 domain-containing protein [Labrys wisconsinensis]|uniref:Ribosome-associated heat shock protein Hsp15 n=1 Tax=Labrys wisconsinensis TaxID=425677 RepID=A0ABU0JM53_9HYPH|nr:RNA-binding S4 domain-containing protein [Labrys wisconsinensis]MDQ0475371.1 ribosome-associated heat shock protein Hsp15 [Labrys wisconsinensis]
MPPVEATPRLRLDKWLWHARVTRTRTLAAKLVAEGHVRVNGVRTDQPAKPVKAGDVLTIALERTVRVYRVRELGDRRGPASEAQALYEDLSPEPPPHHPPAGRGLVPAGQDDED